MGEFSGSHRSGVLYQGPTSVGPMRPDKDLGFSPCVFSLPGKCSGMGTAITGAKQAAEKVISEDGER